MLTLLLNGSTIATNEKNTDDVVDIPPLDPLMCWLNWRCSPSSSDHKIPSVIFVRKMAPSQQGRTRGNLNYGTVETKHLFNIMERILPIGPDEWQQVADEHALTFSDPKRDVDSIRQKYSKLYRQNIPTGDPLMPDDVRQAKRIKWLIGNKASVGDGEEEYDLREGFKNNNNNPATLAPEPNPNPSPPPPAEHIPPATPAPAPAATAPVQQQDEVAVVPPPLSSKKRPYKCYNRSSMSAKFMDCFRLSLMQQQAAREQDRQERREDRKDLMAALSALAQGVALAYAGNKRRRKTSYDSDSD